ncbi:MAG: hypothetical protein AAFZ09_13055, partial [Pseudomonadota bacterium]
LLLERLDAVARERAAVAEGPGLATVLGQAVDAFAGAVTGAIERVPNIPAGVGGGLARFYDPRGVAGTLHLLAVGLAAFGIGVLAERGLRRVMPPLRLPSGGAAPAGLRDTLALLSGRLAREAAGAAVFLAAAWAVMALIHPPEPISYLILTFFLWIPVLYMRVAMAAGRFLIAPNVPALRLVHLDDDSARFLYRAVVIFAALVGMRAYILSFLGGHGVDLASIRMGFWLTLAVYGWLFYVAWRLREAMPPMLTGAGPVTPAEALFAASYPWVSLALIAGFWVITEVFTGMGLWALLDTRLPLTLTILIFGPVVDRAIRGVAAELAPVPGGAGPAADLAERTRQGLVRIGRVVAFTLVLLVLIDLWNVDFSAASMGPAPARLAAGLVEALGIVALGYLVLEGVTLWLTRRLAAELPDEAPEEEEPGGEGGGAGGTRLSTVLPLIIRTVQVVIVV